jgi:hypothetical protein
VIESLAAQEHVIVMKGQKVIHRQTVAEAMPGRRPVNSTLWKSSRANHLCGRNGQPVTDHN